MRSGTPRAEIINAVATMLLRVLMDAGSASPYEKTAAAKRVLAMSAVASERGMTRLTKEQAVALNEKVETAIGKAIEEAMKEPTVDPVQP